MTPRIHLLSVRVHSLRVCGAVLTVLLAGCSHRVPYHGINAGAPVWNGRIAFDDAKARAIAETGCRTVRINFRLDGRADWDREILTTYDAIIGNAVRYKIDVLGLLSNECVNQGQEQWNDDADGDGMNEYVGRFADAAELLVNHYGDRIRRWEIWNEPSCWTQPHWQENPQKAGGSYILPRVYAHLLVETCRRLSRSEDGAMRKDRGISLVSGGLFAHEIGGAFAHAMDYMQQVYDQADLWGAFAADFGRRYPWDLFGYHFYLASDSAITPEQMDRYFEWVRRTQQANDDHAPILVTEFGWNSACKGGDEGQASNMRIAFDHLETLPFVVGAYWYQWSDDGPPQLWGLIRADGSRKPAYDEFVIQQKSR